MESRKNAYYAFCLLFLLYMFDYIDRMVIVALFPFLKRDWGLSDMQCGLLVSAVYWSILVFSLPVSVLVDRWSRKKAIGGMAVFWSLATFACIFTTNFRQLFAARAAIGVGEAGYAPGGTALISALFPPEKRARLLGVWNASIPLGSALGIAVGGIIAEHFGWRHAFGIVALPGLVLALMFFRVRDYRTVRLMKPAGGSRTTVVPEMSRADVVSALLKSKALVFNNLAFAANVFVTTALLSWLPTYFHRMDSMPMSAAGPRSGLIMFLAIVGAPLGGYLSDRWMKTNPRARMLLPAVSSGLTSVLMAIGFTFLQGSIQYALLLWVGVTIIMFVPAAVAVTQDVVHPGLRATSLSLNIVIQHTLGSPLGPLFVGRISDSHGIATAMKLLPAFTLLAAILFCAGAFYYPRDAARVAKIDLIIDP
jgi:predicted MFS family arabinose efflux permease